MAYKFSDTHRRAQQHEEKEYTRHRTVVISDTSFKLFIQLIVSWKAQNKQTIKAMHPDTSKPIFHKIYTLIENDTQVSAKSNPIHI